MTGMMIMTVSLAQAAAVLPMENSGCLKIVKNLRMAGVELQTIFQNLHVREDGDP